MDDQYPAKSGACAGVGTAGPVRMKSSKADLSILIRPFADGERRTQGISPERHIAYSWLTDTRRY